MSELPASAKQKKWYDPTYCGGMSAEEVEAFLGSPDSAWLCRLAVLKEDGWPFVTPMWYQWRDGAFFVVGRKRSEWVQDLIRDPRCFVCIDEEETPPVGGLRKVLARCRATVVEGPVVAEGSQWEPVAAEMALRYMGESGPEGLKLSYGWERYLVRLDPVGEHDDLAGRRLGEALPRPQAARRARGADGRHGVGLSRERGQPARRRSTELCERFRRLYLSAVCDALFHLGTRGEGAAELAAPALPRVGGSSARRSPSRATTSRASAGTRGSSACGRTSRSSSG